MMTSIRFLVLMTVLLGFVYPFAITVMGKLIASEKANGSLLTDSKGQIIGSELIAQGFSAPKYFWPRPSSIDYNPMPSGGSNLGPISKDLLSKVNERKAAGLTEDLLFASASGLDPHISPQGARAQISRIAKARNVDEKKIEELLEQYLEKRQFGFLGEERVNVLKLNLALDKADYAR